jgi:hypothetical protein
MEFHVIGSDVACDPGRIGKLARFRSDKTKSIRPSSHGGFLNRNIVHNFLIRSPVG